MTKTQNSNNQDGGLTPYCKTSFWP